MARRNFAEVATGAVVLLIAGGFLAYAVAHSGQRDHGGYPLHARFDRIDGLGVGSDVRIAGVKVGRVLATAVDPKTFQALVEFNVADDIKLPKDSSAAIESDGLLGGKYIALSPGGEDQVIPPNGEVTITQSSINIEELLGKFVFSVANLNSGDKGAAGSGADKAKPEGKAGGEGAAGGDKLQ
jgi:phospholipid/cholesterol/gamma-HCH transport system substrate-binding protein